MTQNEQHESVPTAMPSCPLFSLALACLTARASCSWRGYPAGLRVLGALGASAANDSFWLDSSGSVQQFRAARHQGHSGDVRERPLAPTDRWRETCMDLGHGGQSSKLLKEAVEGCTRLLITCLASRSAAGQHCLAYKLARSGEIRAFAALSPVAVTI